MNNKLNQRQLANRLQLHNTTLRERDLDKVRNAWESGLKIVEFSGIQGLIFDHEYGMENEKEQVLN